MIPTVSLMLRHELDRQPQPFFDAPFGYTLLLKMRHFFRSNNIFLLVYMTFISDIFSFKQMKETTKLLNQ